MLSCEDLKTINKIPNESDISLKLYSDFFNKHICNRLYNIFLENNINLVMQIAPANFTHLIALNKFKADPLFTGNPLLKDETQLEKFKGFYNLNSEQITLNDLKAVKNVHGKSVYDINKTRILASPFIYQLLRNSDFISFDVNNVIGNSLIKANYIFVNDIDENKLHLFIKDNKGMHYPVSFINRSHALSSDQLNYFIKNQSLIKINKIEVLDFKTKSLLEIITPCQSQSTLSRQEIAASQASVTEQNLGGQAADLKEYSNMDKLRSLSKDGNELSLEQIKAIYLFMKDKVKKGSLDKNDSTFNLLSQINDELNNKLSGNQSSQGIKFDNSSGDIHLK